MKNKGISLKDIANKLKVSTTTVSFVLNGKGKEKKISDEVIRRILDYIKEVNYKPNQVARSLRTGKTRVLVFMVEDISNYFFSKVARIIEDIAYDKGYKILFCSNENNDDRSRELINLFYQRQVDGFILNPSPGIKDDVAMLIRNNVPVVLFDRFFPNLPTDYVVINNERATYDGILHLIKGEYKKVGFITVDSEQTQMKDRLLGYSKAIKDHGLEEFVLKIPYKERSSVKGRKMFLKFLQKNEGLDALFFTTNYLTHNGLEVLKDKYPAKIHEIGIIAFDDNDFFKIHSPSISAVSQPLEEIGESLMDIILKKLEAEVPQEKCYRLILEAKLIKRGSSKPKNQSIFSEV